MLTREILVDRYADIPAHGSLRGSEAVAGARKSRFSLSRLGRKQLSPEQFEMEAKRKEAVALFKEAAKVSHAKVKALREEFQKGSLTSEVTDCEAILSEYTVAVDDH